MDDLKHSFNKLVEKTLSMEDPRLNKQQTLQFSDNDEEYSQNPETMTLSTPENSTELSEKSQDFSQQNNKIVNRHKIRYTATRIKYSPTRIKSRNFLSNISYTGINKNDFYNESFILDVYVLIVKNLNPFSMNRKVADKMKHEMVYMLWRECIPSEFYRYICEEKSFIYLNGKDVSQPGVLEIVGNFIDKSKQNLRMLQENLTWFKDIFQYVYSNVFPEVYTTTEKRGFNLKSNFHILFKTYWDKMIMRQQKTAKNPANYENEQKETCEFKQKPITNFNEFNNIEEQELKQKAKKCKAAKRERAEEAKVKKQKLKEEENKVKEGQMWERLAELNGEFKKI